MSTQLERETKLCRLLGRATALLSEDAIATLLLGQAAKLRETELMELLGRAANLMPLNSRQRVAWAADLEHESQGMIEEVAEPHPLRVAPAGGNEPATPEDLFAEEIERMAESDA